MENHKKKKTFKNWEIRQKKKKKLNKKLEKNRKIQKLGNSGEKIKIGKFKKEKTQFVNSSD